MNDHISGLISRYPALSRCEQGIRDAYALLEKSFAAGGKLLESSLWNSVMVFQ